MEAMERLSTKVRNQPPATCISKCHAQKYYSVLKYHMLLIKNSICLSYKLFLTRLKQISFSILNWHEPEWGRGKKKQKNYAAERQSSLVGAVYTHSE